MPTSVSLIRSLLASYRSGGKVGGMTLNAAKGQTLPANAKEIHLYAPESAETLLAEVDRLTADAQRWANVRSTVTRLDAGSRRGLPMGDDDIEGLVLQILEHAARKHGGTRKSSAIPAFRA